MKDTDLTDVVNAQLAEFKTALGDKVSTYLYDVDSLKNDITGAVILLESIGFDVTNHTQGKLWVKVEFNAHCIMTLAQENCAAEVANLAALVLKIVSKNSWGLNNIQPPEELKALPGRFEAGKGGFESWVASWTQVISIGDTWDGKDFIPEKVFISEAPDIGRQHEPDYEELANGHLPAP